MEKMIRIKGWLWLACVSILTISIHCDHKEKTPAVVTKPDSLATRTRPDSIWGRDIQTNPSLQPGIRLDTSRMDATIRHTGIHIIMPVITGKDHRWLNQQLSKFRRQALSDFIDEAREDTVYEENSFLQGRGMWIQPLSLYSTDSLVSFVLETGSGFTGMPSAYWFPTFNFDNRTGKPISFKDYFLLDSRADTIAWVNTVSKASGRPVEDTRRLFEFEEEIVFGFDDDNVYLCFEKYHPYNYGIIPIQKRSFITSIRSAYR